MAQASCRNCKYCNPRIAYCRGFHIEAIALCKSYVPRDDFVMDPLPEGVKDLGIPGLSEGVVPQATIAVAQVLVQKLATQAVAIVNEQAEAQGHVAGRADYNHGARGLTKNPYKPYTAPYSWWQKGYDFEINADYGGVDQELVRAENAGHTFGRYDRICGVRGQTHSPYAKYSVWFDAWQAGYDYEFDLRGVKDAPVSPGLAGNGDQDGMITTPATQATDAGSG